MYIVTALLFKTAADVGIRVGQSDFNCPFLLFFGDGLSIEGVWQRLIPSPSLEHMHIRLSVHVYGEIGRVRVGSHNGF